MEETAYYNSMHDCTKNYDVSFHILSFSPKTDIFYNFNQTQTQKACSII